MENYGLGSARSNRWALIVWAVLAVAWSGWRFWDYHTGDAVVARLKIRGDIPAPELFGGRIEPGNTMELSIARADVSRLLGVIDAMRYGEILVGLVIILVGLLMLYRFCDRVIAGKQFTRATNTDLIVLGGCIIAYPALTGFMNMLGTNSVIGALDLSAVLDSDRSNPGLYVAIVLAVFLQFVYAIISQGTTLARDTEGLV